MIIRGTGATKDFFGSENGVSVTQFAKFVHLLHPTCYTQFFAHFDIGTHVIGVLHSIDTILKEPMSCGRNAAQKTPKKCSAKVYRQCQTPPQDTVHEGTGRTNEI